MKIPSMDDEIGEEFYGASAGAGLMHIVREGVDKGVTGDALPNP